MGEPTWTDLLSEQVHHSGKLLFQLAFRVLRDSAAAEDAVQKAFLGAWEQRDRLQDGERLKRWLIVTTKNNCLQAIRRRKIEQRGIEARSQDLGQENDPDAADERSEAVRSALARLPERTRNVVIMRTMDELSGNDVATALGISTSEVSRQLHRGLDILRGSLNES